MGHGPGLIKKQLRPIIIDASILFARRAAVKTLLYSWDHGNPSPTVMTEPTLLASNTGPVESCMLPPMPVEQRLAKEEAVALFRKYEERHGRHCENMDIEIEVQRSRDLDEALWDVLDGLDLWRVDKSDDEVRDIVKKFVKSGDVLYCYARACEEWPQGIDEDWEMAMFQLQITLTGWSVVSMGWEDCVPIGGEGYFLLVRDQQSDAVRNLAQLLIDSGSDDDDLMWDRWEIPLEPTLFEERSWRELVPIILPLLPTSNGEEDISMRHWSDDMPLFDIMEGDPTGWKATNSMHAKFIMELFDHSHAMTNGLVKNARNLTKRIRGLNQEKRSMSLEAAALRSEIKALASRIVDLEVELTRARLAQEDDAQPKKRKGTNNKEGKPSSS